MERPPAPELAACAEEIEAQTVEIETLVADLTDGQLNWRPEPGRWSIGEHIDHLTITNGRYLDAIDAAVDRARERGLLGSGPFRRLRVGEWFVRSMEPPPRMRLPTLRSLQPAAGRAGAEVLAAFRASQARVTASLHRAAGVDLGRATMRSPFMRLLRLTLDQAFRVVAAHNRRHIWHARAVLRRPEFPEA